MGFVLNDSRQVTGEGFKNILNHDTNEVLAFPQSMSDNDISQAISDDKNGTITQSKPNWYNDKIRPVLENLDIFKPKFLGAAVEPDATRAFVTTFAKDATFGILENKNPEVMALNEESKAQHPIATMAGSLAGQTQAILMTAGLGEAFGLGKLAEASGKVAGKIGANVTSGAGVGALYGAITSSVKEINKSIDENSHPDLVKVGQDALKDAGIFALYGVPGSIASLPVATAAIAGTAYSVSKLEGASEQDALLNAAVMGIFHAVNTGSQSKEKLSQHQEALDKVKSDYIKAVNPAIHDAIVDRTAQEHTMAMQDAVDEKVQLDTAGKRIDGKPITVGGGEPPQKGLVVANIGSDGKIYYGKPGQLHYNLLEKYGDNLRQGLEEGEPTFTKVGFSGPDGKYLTREDALKVSGIKSTETYLDAKEYQIKQKNIPKDFFLNQPIEKQVINQQVEDILNIDPTKLDEQRSANIKKMGGLSSEIGSANLPGVDELADITKEAIHVISPRSFVPKPALDEIMKMKGGQDRAQFELETKLQKVTETMDKWPKEKQISFIDNIKAGKSQESEGLDKLAKMMRTIEDNYWQEAKQYKDSLSYKENHYRVLWKTIPGEKSAIKKGFNGIFRKPLQGTKGFSKQSTLESMSEGIAMGGEPYTYNPMKMWQDGIVDMQKFITAQRMFKSMKNMGYAKFVKSGGDVPEGFIPLNDSIAKTYFPAEIQYTEGGEKFTKPVPIGEYYVEENVGRVLNNFLSKDLIRSSKLGSSLLALKNITTSLELSLSPFHAAYVSLATQSSSIGLGLQKIVNRAVMQQKPEAFLDGLKDIVLAGGAPIDYAKTGWKAIKFIAQDEFINTPEGKEFIKEYPEAKQLMEDLFTGGGKLAIHQDYKINAIRSFQEGLKNKEPWAVGWNAIPAANELIMKPLFETYIPRLKIGTFLKEYSLELAQRQSELSSGSVTRPELARKVWDNVENRLGEMNFDNLFWDRTFKSGLQLAFRSVTWKIGALKNIGQALPDQIGEISKSIEQGRAPLLTANMGWLVGVGALASIFSYVTMGLTGQGQPKDLKDIIAPQYDKDGNRISLNTHIKDWVHIWHNPLGFISNSLSGQIGRVLDVWNNKDFYGVEIHHPDDPALKQAAEIAIHLFPTPFSISSQKKLKGDEAPAALKVSTALGFTQPSPAYISNTAAMEEAYKINSGKYPSGSRTKEEFDKQQLKSQLRDEYSRTGNKNNILKAEEDHKISPKEASSIIKDSKLSTIERLTKHMTYEEVGKVIEKSNPSEKEELIKIFKTKVQNKLKIVSGDDEKQVLEYKEKLLKRFNQ